MRNNLQNDRLIKNGLPSVSKFNLSGSYANTATVGEVSVKFSRELQAGTKAMCGEDSLIFLAPMVAPTYAKQFYKTWHNFIPIEDIWPNRSAFLTKQPISRNGTTFTPTLEPCIHKDVLTAFLLQGAKATIYLKRVDNAPAPEDTDIRSLVSGGYSAVNESVQGDWKTAAEYAINAVWSRDSLTRPHLHVGSLLRDLSYDHLNCIFDLDSGNLTVDSFKVYDSVDAGQDDWYGYDLTGQVMLDSSDFNVYMYMPKSESHCDYDYMVCFAFRLSSFGMHLSKVLRGLGYCFDLDAAMEDVSILPLLATYKAYWDIFGLNMWTNFESTYCGQIISYLQNTNDVRVGDSFRLFNLFFNFIRNELGLMFVTEKNDYVSAHLPQPVVSATNSTPLYGVVDVVPNVNGPFTSEPYHRISAGGSPDPINGMPTDRVVGDGHAYINNPIHGYLDSEILRRLYQRTNANTAFGRKIADLMRSQGLGTYMERTRVHYIGDTSIPIIVNSVISQADTFKESSGTIEGAMLGQRGGRGVGRTDEDRPPKKLFYKTDSVGYWICLDAITCDSGYSQAEDLTLKNVVQTQKYQPDYENLGLQLDSKAVVNGTRFEAFGNLVLDNEKRRKLSMSSQPFGFAPRMSEYKVGRSTSAGGFALRSLRNTFLGYIMDKQIFPDEFYNSDISALNSNVPHAPNSSIYLHMLAMKAEDVPVSGNAWKFLNRYPWMGNLLRIFAYQGKSPSYSLWLDHVQDPDFDFKELAKVWEYHYRTDDNYILLGEVWFKAWSHMLPIEETYGTVDTDKRELDMVETC